MCLFSLWTGSALPALCRAQTSYSMADVHEKKADKDQLDTIHWEYCEMIRRLGICFDFIVLYSGNS